MQHLTVGTVFTRRDIAVLFGGNARAFLPRAGGGDVVAGCFDPAKNPRAPAEVLVHSSPNAMLAAERLIEQGNKPAGTVPVFLRLAPNVWEYIGRFRAVRYSSDPSEVAERIYEIHPRIYQRYAQEYGEMKGILFLEEE
jgi:hypothetical protein